MTGRTRAWRRISFDSKTPPRASGTRARGRRDETGATGGRLVAPNRRGVKWAHGAADAALFLSCQCFGGESSSVFSKNNVGTSESPPDEHSGTRARRAQSACARSRRIKLRSRPRRACHAAHEPAIYPLHRPWPPATRSAPASFRAEARSTVVEPAWPSPDGRTLVFVHGWPDTVDMWTPLIERLSKQGHKCVCVPLPWYPGGSDPEKRPDFDTAARDVALLVEKRKSRWCATTGAASWGSRS